jgi:hypothetical protein
MAIGASNRHRCNDDAAVVTEVDDVLCDSEKLETIAVVPSNVDAWPFTPAALDVLTSMQPVISPLASSLSSPAFSAPRLRVHPRSSVARLN